MKLLITGGGGLIGQAIAKRHLSSGDSVFIYDTRINEYNDYSNLLGKDVTWINWENSNFQRSIHNVLEMYGPFDVISHQAALVGVGQSQYKISEYVYNNIQFTADLLQAMLDSQKLPKKIINAGSMGPYGNPDEAELPVDENYTQNPQSIYAVTKQAQENLLKVFSSAYSVSVFSLRYFSVYGTNQSPLNPYTGVLSVIGNQLLNSNKVELYEDGNQTRDLVHVDDVAEAHFLASRVDDIPFFTPINICTGASYSLAEIAYLMEDIIDSGKPIVFTGQIRSGDIRDMLGDSSRARKILKWQPKHFLLEDIIEYCNFLMENGDKFTVGNTIQEEHTNIQSKGLISDARP